VRLREQGDGRDRAFVFLVPIVSLLLGVIPAAQADTVQRTEEYVAGFAGDTDGLCAEDPLNASGLNIGAVCFNAQKDKVRLQISDVTALPIGGAYVFLDSDGAAVGGAIGFCGSTPNAPIPARAKTLIVYIGGPAYGPSVCLLDGPGDQLGIGTAGEVRATFTH